MTKSKKTRRGDFGKAKGLHQIRRKQLHQKRFGHSQHGVETNNYSVKTVTNDGMKIILKKYGSPDSYDKFVITRYVCTEKLCKLYLRRVKQIISGYRLFSVNKLDKHINSIISHCSVCEKAKQLINEGKEGFQIKRDSKHYGLATILLGECMGCFLKFYIDSSDKIQTVEKKKHYDVNVRSVWGTMVTGRGNSSINELCGTLDMPGMSRKTFTQIESEIGELWEKVLLEDLLSAGTEERKLAIERGRYFQGVPAITVVCDGGWSKRSHRHTYNALGGVAIIVGAATKKILYIGVRNKYCFICTKAVNKKEEPKPHQCFKNWKKSSQAMEADIIVQGFLEAESMHGVRYMEIIGDGDSSVYARITEEVPVWGSQVQKIECANHICKCLRTNLEKLVEDNKEYKGRHNLTKPLRGKLVATVRSAISYRHDKFISDDQDKATTTKLLQHDIRNALLHLSRDHSNCSDFCLVKRKEISASSNTESAVESSVLSKDLSGSVTVEEEKIPDSIESVLSDQVTYWDLTSDSLLHVTDSSFKPSEDLKKDVYILLDKVACKADRLLDNATTNLAESWMSVRMKCDGGKVFNRCSRGSWNYRCYGGALRKNYGPAWAPKVWETSIGTPAGDNFRSLYSFRKRHHTTSLKTQSQPSAKEHRMKRKLRTSKESNTTSAKQAYGSEAVDVVPDVTPDILQNSMDSYVAREINISEQDMLNICENTKLQSLCGFWIDERKKRLTASNFCDVVKRKPSILVKPLVQRLLYTKFTGNRLTRKGLRLEKYALEEYKRFKRNQNENVTIQSVGLFISRENPFLAASPDGLVESDVAGTGLVEVKHILLSKTFSFEEATEKDKSFCLELINKKLCLKKTHKFYYQIQGQMNILNISWLDLVVRRIEPYQLFVHRFNRDRDMWENNMLPKLSAFYHKAILPELASPRYGKSPGIREPGVWYSGTVKSVAYKRPSATCTTHSATQSTPSPTTSNTPTVSPAKRSPRHRRQTFLGRYISHEWLDEFGRSEWYSGYITNILDGIDGESSALYEILYDNYDDPFEVDHLVEDYESNSVVFLDL